MLLTSPPRSRIPPSAVLATIGGDDQITVIPHLDATIVAANPKPFLGYRPLIAHSVQAVGCDWQDFDVQFDFNLVRSAPGWADPKVEIGGRSIEMCASYLTDALGDLLNSMMLLVNGSPVAECEWTQEPGGWRWTFIRRSVTQTDVRIAFKPDVFEEHWFPHDPGEVRADVRLPLDEVVRAIVMGCRRCFDEFGATGFASQWLEHPFPLLQLEALESWLHVGVVAPLFEPE